MVGRLVSKQGETKMTKQAELENAMFEQSRREFDGECVNDLSEVSKGYRGLVLHVNDHGNVTLYMAFKCGTVHEITSRV